jgi:hypothetical protein
MLMHNKGAARMFRAQQRSEWERYAGTDLRGRTLAILGVGKIGRELARLADAAVAYARAFPDVADVHADPLGHRLTDQFKSGWRAGVAPIADGKRGAETPGVAVPAAAR